MKEFRRFLMLCGNFLVLAGMVSYHTSDNPVRGVFILACGAVCMVPRHKDDLL